MSFDFSHLANPLVVSSIVFKGIQEVLIEKNKEVLIEKISSVRVEGEQIIICTRSPLVNQQLTFLESEIISKIQEIFDGMGKKYTRLQISYA